MMQRPFDPRRQQMLGGGGGGGGGNLLAQLISQLTAGQRGTMGAMRAGLSEQPIRGMVGPQEARGDVEHVRPSNPLAELPNITINPAMLGQIAQQIPPEMIQGLIGQVIGMMAQGGGGGVPQGRMPEPEDDQALVDSMMVDLGQGP